MEVAQVLHMEGGLGDSSYANNSLLQRKVLSLTRPITEEAITQLYTTMHHPKTAVICIADMGCGSGSNVFFVMAELVKTVDKLCQKLGRQLPEFQINLIDLPGNDFNSIFQSMLPKFQEELTRETMLSESGTCFVNGVPGTFYGRLFPAKSLHFVHSSYSLMWLSKVPKEVEMDKENIFLASSSPPSVISAYYEQFHCDFTTFLKCRSAEVVSGGKMVLTIRGRKSKDRCSKDACYVWELLAVALREMVSEGRIEEEKFHSFHIPEYNPSPKEISIAVVKEGSFTIDYLGVSEIPWTACSSSGNGGVDYGYGMAKCMRSVVQALLVRHFGESVMDYLFEKVGEVVSDRMSKEELKLINVTVSMTRK